MPWWRARGSNKKEILSATEERKFVALEKKKIVRFNSKGDTLKDEILFRRMATRNFLPKRWTAGRKGNFHSKLKRIEAESHVLIKNSCFFHQMSLGRNSQKLSFFLYNISVKRNSSH